jgi:hypothetical protein
MSKFKEIIVSTFLPAIKEVGKIELEAVLASIRDNNNQEVYSNTLRSLHSNFSLLREASVKTKTQIDDGIVNLVLEAVSDRAEADKVSL